MEQGLEKPPEPTHAGPIRRPFRAPTSSFRCLTHCSPLPKLVFRTGGSLVLPLHYPPKGSGATRDRPLATLEPSPTRPNSDFDGASHSQNQEATAGVLRDVRLLIDSCPRLRVDQHSNPPQRLD